MYNFQVEDHHTYYVGNSTILVHNADKYSSNITPDMEKRILDSSKLQQRARQEAIAVRIDQNIENGMLYEDACNEAIAWAKGKAVLHGPDQIAGGSPDNITGLGDSRINSSIGAQWREKSRIDALDAYVEKLSSGLTQEERSTTYLNVELVLKGRK